MKRLFQKAANTKIAKSQSFRQLIKYGLVGVVGLVVDMGLYYLLVDKFSVHYAFSQTISELLSSNMSVRMIDILVSNIIGQSLAVINNFILNSYFTFKVTDAKLKRFVTFASVAIVGMFFSSILLTLFIGVIGMNTMLAKALSVLIVAMMQFGINKFYTFKKQ